ncbi:MAG: N-6 DNA methylase [Nitrospirae bacterium]|nr:N-6 DNA methylase [Nitrospirota bacterium]
MLSRYLNEITEIANYGDAREETYYPALTDLLNEYITAISRKDAVVVPFPKKTEGGNPDFRIWDGKQRIVGYIEAKEPKYEDLTNIEVSEQLKRYMYTFPNLMLTNFLEFRLYRNGELIDKVTIGRPLVLNKLKITPPVENETGLLNLLDKFFSFSLPKVYDARSLAIELAKRTRFLRDVILTHIFSDNNKSSGKGIEGFYDAFSTYLIGSLKKEDFADIFAQTVTYGLFVARTRCNNGFSRVMAFASVPKTLGILKDVFRFISSTELPRHMEWSIDDISEVLAITEVKAILHHYYHEGKGNDPIVHFYETFLSEYDPGTRERRGVYYTPEPVVSYIVRSLNIILKDKFSMPYGLAGDKVTLLDPAAGTCTFLSEASKLAIQEYTASYGSGDQSGFIKRRILEDFYGFELMMAPYAIGHLKMSFILEEMGYTLQDDERIKVYITNTLDMEALGLTKIPGLSSLSEESHMAGSVKKDTPILVILGNPPYSGHSSNVGAWISKEIRAYYTIDGKALKEKNPKWLQDDYVKFIRFAQWKIDREGEGVLGFITNHSYLDNPTFRGMRRSLMDSFDEIYILDLHGNSRKKERCPDGSKDENVFDIQQGVAIAFFVKRKGIPKRIAYTEMFGERETKYSWLNENDINTTKWVDVQPKPEHYFFIPRDERLLSAYDKFIKITDIFPINSVGIVTARDSLTIQWTKDEMWQTVLNFSKLDAELARKAYNLGRDTRDWKVDLAQKDLLKSGLDKERIMPILYRPFDIRFTYYTGKTRGFHCMPRSEVMQHITCHTETPGGFLCRPRPKVMQHMMQDNVGLLACRQQNKIGFHHAFVSTEIAESCVVSNETKEITYLFPLYLYLSHFEGKEVIKQSNINHNIIQSLSKIYKKEPSPEESFYYIYSVLYSNRYRTKYAEFLKTDFPKIPFTEDHGLFINISEHGKRLVQLHLLKSPELDPPIARYQGKGDNRVRKLKYDDKEKHLYINETQYFEGIKNDVWRYRIGSYQVCEKWLKDRKERPLSFEEIKTYCKIVTALQKTTEIQSEIDLLYDKLENAII